jgi:hypothetical protein
MTKHANCVVLIMFAKIARVAAVALELALADPRPAVVSSLKANRSAVRWEPMQRILALVRRVAMRALPLVKNALTTLAHAMTILATAPKVLVRRVLPEIVRKVIVRHFKIVVRVRKATAHKVIVRPIKIVVPALKATVHRVIVRLTKTVARVHRVARIAIQPNSVAGMCPMVSIPAHV